MMLCLVTERRDCVPRTWSDSQACPPCHTDPFHLYRLREYEWKNAVSFNEAYWRWANDRFMIKIKCSYLPIVNVNIWAITFCPPDRLLMPQDYGLLYRKGGWPGNFQKPVTLLQWMCFPHPLPACTLVSLPCFLHGQAEEGCKILTALSGGERRDFHPSIPGWTDRPTDSLYIKRLCWSLYYAF